MYSKETSEFVGKTLRGPGGTTNPGEYFTYAFKGAEGELRGVAKWSCWAGCATRPFKDYLKADQEAREAALKPAAVRTRKTVER